MAQTVKLAANNIAGTIQGNFGTYVVGSDGTITVDSRDVPAMLVAGASYLNNQTMVYNTLVAPAAASATAYLASTTLANGAVSLTTMPDVLRQAQLVVGQLASPGPSGGTVSIVYTANDGSRQTDTFNLVNGNVNPYTTQLSKGVARFITGTVSGLAGSGFITLGSTSALSVPVPLGSQDVVFLKESLSTGDETVGTSSGVTLASITPSVIPNATRTYSFMYGLISPDI